MQEQQLILNVATVLQYPAISTIKQKICSVVNSNLYSLRGIFCNYYQLSSITVDVY
jgi:hypothetical protein